jgi:hypothetical protein
MDNVHLFETSIPKPRIRALSFWLLPWRADAFLKAERAGELV